MLGLYIIVIKLTICNSSEHFHVCGYLRKLRQRRRL